MPVKPEEPSSIVDPHGRPARQADDDACPRCRAAYERRKLSGGFGELHDVCSACGYDFPERTL